MSDAPVLHPRLAVLDALRGIAALWVGLYHYTANGRFYEGFPADQPLKSLGHYGYLGVYAFFVISGFILPWTMARSGYQWSDCGRFLAKRVLRLHPLYLLSVAVVLSGILLGPAPPASPEVWSITWPHLFYANGMMGRPWFLEIYWTLALEAQYYLALGVLFPLLNHHGEILRRLMLAIVLVLPLWLPHHGWVSAYSALFGMGILHFLRLRGRIGKWEFTGGIVLALAVSYRVVGSGAAWVGLAAVVILTSLQLRHPVLAWLGTVSYPFYLFHLPVFSCGMPLMLSLPRNPWRDGAAILGLMGISLAVSWTLHRWVEMPAQRWSSRIRYRRRK